VAHSTGSPSSYLEVSSLADRCTPVSIVTQGTSRCVLLAGTPSQVAASLAAAEPYREQLLQRGVFIVPVPIFDEPASSSGSGGDEQQGQQQQAAATIPPLERGDLRWRGEAQQLQGYKQWFQDQLSFSSSKVTSDTGAAARHKFFSLLTELEVIF
jgi:hypothetical protein